MRISQIVKGINEKLAGELLSRHELNIYIDNVIDDINSELNAKFPAFSELEPEVTDYDFFPDKYVRSVVIQGAAWYYYVTDEEGAQAAMQYELLYRKALFNMVRDYSEYVPLQYQIHERIGGVQFEFPDAVGICIRSTEGVD